MAFVKTKFTKVCTHCQEELPNDYDHFLKRKQGKRADGTHRYVTSFKCISCSSLKLPRKVKPVYRTCNQCNKTLPRTEEYFVLVNPERRSWSYGCIECRAKKQKIKDREREFGIRVCRKCGEEKPLTLEYFPEQKAKSNGENYLAGVCRVCACRKSKGWYENREEGHNKKRYITYGKAHAEKTRDRTRTRQRERYANDEEYREKSKRVKREKLANNPEYRKKVNDKRNAILREAAAICTHSYIKAMLKEHLDRDVINAMPTVLLESYRLKILLNREIRSCTKS